MEYQSLRDDFLGKIRNIFQLPSAEIFTRHAKR